MKLIQIKKGFTLVEIMIVVAIIGLLAAIGIPYVASAFENAKQKAKEHNIVQVEKAKMTQTLPTEVGGLNKKETDDIDQAQLFKNLNISDLSEMNVSGDPISINTFGIKAAY